MGKYLSVKAKPYQVKAVAFHIKARYSINGFEMGLGKTLIGIATSLIRGLTTLVVCPAFLTNNWKDEIEKLSVNKVKATILNSRIKPNGSQFYIVSYSSFSRIEDISQEIDFVICDEVHYLKNPTAKRTKQIHKFIETKKPEMFLGLSGTPIKNNIPEYWSILKLCHYGGNYPQFDKYDKQWAFCRDFALKIPNPYSPMGWEWGGAKNVSELVELLKPVYTRKKADNVLDLPEQVYKHIRISDKSKHDKELELAWKDYTSGNMDRDSFASAKAVNALAKVKSTIEQCQLLLDEGRKVVVFSDHVQACEEIAKALGGKSITGKTPTDKRHEIVKEFFGDLNVLCATIGAASTGINLYAAYDMVINDYPWVPGDLDQAEKRIHRIGQTRTCFYYYIFSSDMDYYIFQTLKKKRQIIDEVVNGDIRKVREIY